MKRIIAEATLIVLLSSAAYYNSLHNAFQLDDALFLLDKKITGPSRVGQLLQFDQNRPLTMLTFRFNYFLSGENTFSYHLFNLALHAANALLVYWLVLLTFQKARLAAAGKKYPGARFFPLTTALLFALHPVQTQTMNHIYERAVMLATFFFLLAFIFFLLATYSERRVLHVLCPIFFVLALASKEMTMTLPAVLLLYDYIFIAEGDWRKVKTRAGLYLILIGLSFFAGWRILYIWSHLKPEGIGFTTKGITPYQYLLTEFGVLTKYIQLLIFPYVLNVDYDLPIVTSFWAFKALLPFLLIVFLIALAIKLRKTEKVISFAILYFFITLAPESSVVPIIDVIFEHRLYLPSLGFCLAAAVLLGKLPDFKFIAWRSARVGLAPLLAFVLVCGIFLFKTIDRNKVWKDPVTLWRDAVVQSPNKVRPHNNLGWALYNAGLVDPAIAEYEIALRLDPNSMEAHYNLGRARYDKGQIDVAIAEYKTALSIQPRYLFAIFQLGNAYRGKGDFTGAIEQYQKAIRLDPTQPLYYNNLGNVYNDLGLMDEAIKTYRQGLTFQPLHRDTRLNLSIALYKKGWLDAAIAELKQVIAIDPQHFDAHYRLAVLYHSKGMLDEALAEYKRLAHINPKDPRVYNNMGAILIERNRLDEAIQAFHSALALQPSYLNAHFNLAVALHKKGDYAESSRRLDFVLVSDKDRVYTRERFEQSVGN